MKKILKIKKVVLPRVFRRLNKKIPAFFRRIKKIGKTPLSADKLDEKILQIFRRTETPKTEIKRPVVSLSNPEPSPVPAALSLRGVGLATRQSLGYLDRRLFAIQKSTRTKFEIFQRFNEKLRLRFKWYYNLRVDPLYAYGNMDDQMAAIQHSTKTLFKFFAPVHEKLRQKYSWYYTWHVRPHSSKIHWGILATYSAAIVICIGIGIFGGQHRPARAATLSNCTWTNGGGTNNWSTATNWSCGNVPTNSNNVIFDGAVSSAPMTIDVAADVAAASFTTKGTNLPTTGNVAYTGTITANADLTLDTTNAGTGSFYLGAGTYVANATTITVPGNFTAGTGFGTFTYGTSTVNLTGTGTFTPNTYYNFQGAAAGKTSTTTGSQYSIYGTMTLGSGTLVSNTWGPILYGSGTPLVNGGATLTNSAIQYMGPGSGTTYVAGGNYASSIIIRGNGTFKPTGNITLTGATYFEVLWAASSNTAIFDTDGYNITTGTSGLQLSTSDYSNYGTHTFIGTGASIITVNGPVLIYNANGVKHQTLDISGLTSGSFSVTGTWTNNDTFTPGTNTVNFTGTGTQTINSGGVGAGKMFYNVTHSGTGTLQLLTNAINIDGNFSQTAGIFNSNALNQSFAGNFSITGGTYTKGGTLTFDGTTSYSDLTATPQNIGAVTLNGTSLTIASGTMQTDALTVTTGNLIQTTGNIKTTGAVSVAASQNWTNNGTGDVTLGGNVTNAGTVTFNGDEAGGQDSISILSSAASARTWTLTGAGTFSFTDVSVSYQTGAAGITATSSNDGGNNTSWTFATNKVISGSIYNGIGGSKITAAKTIAVSVNGAAASTVESSNGDYTLTLGGDLAANDKVAVFVSGETEKASAISKTSVAASGINIDLFQNYTVIRHEGTIASIAYADLAVADDLADSDLLFSVDGSNVATFTQGVYIMGNKTYAPGANATLSVGNWANYGTLTPSTFTITFSAGSGTQSVYASDTAATPYTGTNKAFYNLTHSGAGTLQLSTNLDVNNTLTNSSGPLDLNSLIAFASGAVTMTGSSITGTGGSTITFDGTLGQTFTTAGLAYNNITLNNTGTAGANERITVTGNLDINGALTITDGSLYLATSNPNVNTAGAVTIASTGLVNKGTGTWTFDGTTTYTDNEATKSNIGPVVINGTSATLASSMTVDTMTVTSGILDLGTANYTLKLANAGAVADVLSVSGTFTVGTNSTVQYSATNSGGNVNVLTIPYDNLQFTPISGSESYNLTGSLTDANAMAGNITIDANATVNTYVGTTSYDISCVNFTINQSGVLYAGTTGSTGTSTYNISGNWWQYNATATFTNVGLSTVNLTGSGTVTAGNLATVYNMNAAAAGQTTTFSGSFCISKVLTLGTGTAAGTGTVFLNGSGTPLVTSGATITVSINYFTVGQNIASTTYSALSFTFNGGGTDTLLGPVTATSCLLVPGNNNQYGILSANNNNFSCSSLAIGATGATLKNSALNMGSGTLSVTGDVTINATSGASHNTLSFTSGTANIGGNFTNSDTFTYGTSTVNFNGTTPTTISGTTANTFYNLTAVPGKNIIFPAGVTQTIAAGGSLGFTGSTAGMVHLRSSVPGTRWNISVPADQNVSYVDVKDSAQTNGAFTITDNNGNNAGNNSQWVFTGAGPRYWVAAADGDWNNTANWATQSDGSGGNSVPTSGNPAIFDQAAGNGSYACTINTATTVDDIQVASYTNTITINALTTVNADIVMTSGTINAASAGTVAINGDLLLSGTATFTAPNSNLNIAGNFINSATFTPGTGATIFTSTGTGRTITSGTAHFYNLVFNGTGGSWSFGDDPTIDGNFTITAGTVDGTNKTINIGGSWNSSITAGTFTPNTSTVNLTGTGTVATKALGSSPYDFYDLNASASNKTSTMSNNIYISDVLTLGTGTLIGSNSVLLQSGGTPLVNAGATITTITISYRGTTSTNVAGGTYATLSIQPSATATLQGTLLITGNLNVSTATVAGPTIFNTNGNNITTAALFVGSTSTTYNGTLSMGSGSLTVTGNTTIYAQTGANHNTLDLGSGTHYFGGTYANSDTLTAGTSTVNFNGAGTQTLNSGGVGAGKLFNNLTHSGAGTLQLLTNNLDVDGTFSQTAGTFNANAKNQNFAGDFSITGGTYTKGGTLTFDGTTSYTDTSATSQDIGAVTLNGTSITVASGTMYATSITVAVGSLIQTAGNIKTGGAVSVAASQNWTNNGTGDVTLGGNVSNAGTVTFNGDEATGGADPISILSTAASARTWTLTGAGSFSFTDVSVSYQTGAASITATSSNDGGNNVNWVFGTNKVISGSIYDGIGGSKITSALTVEVTVNGVAEASTVESSSGDYTLTLAVNLAANDIVSVFLSGETEKASAITKTSVAASGINIDLFQNYTVIRHEGMITSIAYADLAIADNIADSDLLVSVDGSNVATFTKGIYILTNKTYAPGANIVVQGNFANEGAFTASTFTVTFDGTGTVERGSTVNFYDVTINNTKTLTGHSTNMNVARHFLNNGTFTHNSGTLTFNGTTGQTFTDGAQTYNNIVLNNTGTAGANERITVSGNLDINGNLTITDGALYLVTNNPTVNVAGSVAIASTGIVTKGSGAWTFDGTTAATFADFSSSDLGVVTINKTDTVAPETNNVLTVTGGVQMKNSGLTVDGTAGQEDTLSIASGKYVRVLAGSTTTIQTGATVSGLGYLALNDTAGANLATTGTLSSLVIFDAVTASVTIPARTYDGSVTANNSTSSNYSATLGTAGGQTLNFSSNLTCTANSTGQLNVKGDTNNPTINITGNYTLTKVSTGTLSITMGSSTWTVGGNWSTVGGGGLTASTGSKLILNGEEKTFIPDGWPTSTFYDVQISGNITYNKEQTYISHNLTVDSGKIFTIYNIQVLDMNNGSSTTINGTISGGTLGTGVLELRGSAMDNLSTAGTLTAQVRAYGSYFGQGKLPARTYEGMVTVYSGDSNANTTTLGTDVGQTLNFNGGLTFRNGSTGPVSLIGTTYNPTVNVAGNISTTALSTGITTLSMGSGAWNVGGSIDFTNTTVTAGASTLTMNNANGLVTQTLDNNDQTLNNLTHSGAGTLQLINHALTLNGTLTNSAGFFNANNLDLTIAGSLNNTATMTNFSTNTVTFNSDSGSIQTSGSNINNLTVNHTGGSYQLSDALTATGNVTITAGTLDANGNNMTVGGNWSNADTFTSGANTVTFNKATGTQTLNSGGVAAGKLFNNVTHSGAGTLQLDTNAINIDGNFTNSAGTFSTSSNNMSIAGNFNTTGGIFTPVSSTVTFDGAVAQAITSASQPFYNLTLNNSGTGAGDDITPADALDVNGTFTITDGEFSPSSNNINVAGDMTISTAGTFTKGNGTTTFDGALTPSILTDSSTAAPQNLGFITINKNNIITPAANLLTLATATLLDSMTIAASNILNAAGFAISDTGDWTNNGTFTSGNNTVTLNSASAQTIKSNGSSFNNLNINNGLVGYWKLDEGTGTNAVDSSGYGKDGTLTGATHLPTWNSSVKDSTYYGNDSNGVNFDGTEDSINVPENDLYGFGTGDFAVSYWANWDTTTGYQVPIDGGYGSNAGILIENQGGSVVRVYLGTTYVGIWNFSVTPGTWYHFAVTRTGGQVNVYVDGSQVGSPVANSTSVAKSSYLIGKYGGGEWFDGTMDDVRIYNRTLTPTEITELYGGSSATEGTYTLSDALDVNGNLNVETGKLDVSAGNYDINVAGNYKNVANFDGRAGTFTMDASSGTKTLQSDPSFNSLTVNATGAVVQLAGQRLDVNGNFANSAGEFSPGSNNVSVAGNFSTTGGTFTAGTSTVTLDGAGASTQNVSGSTTFYKFTAQAAAARTIKFAAGSTTTVTNILDIDGAAGQLLILNSSSNGSYWNFNVSSATPVATYVDVKDSNASGGNQIDATTGGTNSGHNLNWLFTAGGITIGGSCKAFDESTNCADSETVKFAVGGNLMPQTATTSSGTWTISAVGEMDAGEIITIFIDNVADTNEANAVTKYDGTGNVTGILLYEDHLTIGSDDNQTLTNANLAIYDNSVSTDEDIFFEVDASNDLNTDATSQTTQDKIYVKTSNTYRPDSASSGNITTVNLTNAGTITADGNSFTVAGDWANSGTFTCGTSTVTFSSTATGKTINSGASPFYNMTFNGSGGAWSFGANSADITNNFTITAGTVTLPSTTLIVAGNFDNSATFTHNSGTVKLTGTDDNNTLKTNGSAFNNLEQNNGLVGYWKLDEGTGINAVDSSGYGKDGTLTGPTHLPTWDSSVNNASYYGGDPYGVNFDGTEDSIAVSENDLYGFGTGDFAVSYWIKWDGTSGYQVPIDSGFTSSKGILIENQGGTVVRIYINAAYVGIWNFSATPGTWYHFATTRTGGQVNVYVDGSQVGSPVANNTSVTKSNLLIGKYGNGEYVDGTMDDVRIYNRSLAPTEITELYGGSSATEGTYTLQDPLDVNGNATITGGTLNANGQNMTVGGNWTDNGTFTSGTGTVTFDSTNASAITGSTTFNNLAMNTTTDGAKTITFPTGSGNKQVVAGTWTLDGAVGKVLTLASATPDTAWYFDLIAPFTSGDYIDVKDSWSADTNKITPGANVTNSGNNDGWIFNQTPNAPTSLLQKKVTGGATLSTGDWTGENQVEFTALADDSDASDTLYLCVEKDYIETALASTNGGDQCGTGVAYTNPTPVTVSVTITGLTDAAEYHWQAQVKDAATAYSSFVGYGANTENPPTNPAATDFGVDTTAPTGGTVNDGTSTDVDYNDGSLTTLSANWFGVDASTSGLLKYEYAIGTTSGGTDTKAWTDNSTTASVTDSGLSLRTGQTYYFSIRTTDNANNVSTPINSNGQAVAPTLTFGYLGGDTVTFEKLGPNNSYTDDTKETILQTSTNAFGGYVVKARAIDALRSPSNIALLIAHYAGLNTTPTSWSGTGFGYSTNDDNLSGGTADRFTNGGPKFAGWVEDAPGDIIADHTSNIVGAPITDEQFTIKYRVTANAMTAAGFYRTMIVYTAIPQY